MHAVLKGARRGDVADVGPARCKYFSKLANLVFNWCRLNFCSGKIYICSISGQNFANICENRGAAGLLIARYRSIVLLCRRLSAGHAQSTSNLERW